MTMQRTTLVWPFMLTLTFLFAISLTAPRTWETVAQRHPLRMVNVGIRFELVTTMPSLIVSNVTSAVPAPRTADRFVTRVEPNPTLSAKVEPTKPAPVAVVEPKLAPAVEPATANVEVTTAAPRLSARPAPSPFVNSSPTVDKPSLSAPSAPKVTEEPAAAPIPTPVSVQTPVAPTPVVEPVAAPTFNSPRLSGGPRLSGSPQPQSATPPVAVPTVTAPVAAPVAIAVPVETAAPAETVAPVQAEPVLAQPVQLQAPQPTVIVAIPQQAVARNVEPTPAATIVQPIDATPIQSWWPEPVDLLARIAKLQKHDATRPWADRASAVLKRLATAGEPTSPETIGLLDDLRTVAADPVVVDDSRLDPQAAVELRLARHAMLRRVDVWESLTYVLRNGKPTVDAVATDDPQGIELCLAELEQQTAAAGETGRQWRSYLLVDSLRQTLKQGGANDRRALAREVLARFRQAGTQRSENEFLRQGPFARLDGFLRGWAEDDVDPHRLLAGIERFEQGGLPSDGRELAEESRLLTRSTNESKQRLAVWLTSHYRNSNVRVTFSPDLVNRILPDSLKQQTAVNDTILGNPTRGWGTSRTGLSVKFLPSRDQLAVRLEARGVINSQTRTFSGPVRMFHHNNSTFAAHKDLNLTTHGVKVSPSVALSQANSKLRGMESDFDGVPIIQGIVSSLAMDKHDEKRPAALREAAWKTARRVEQGLDADIEKQLVQGGSALKERILSPLEKMQLQPEIIDLHTLEDRGTIRLRIAGEDQLAANTPRPRAYSDNVGSMQIHQSAANNIVDRLGLQGRRYSPADLYRHVVATLNLQQNHDLSQIPPDVEFQFAATDPLTLSFDDGKVELRLALDELKCGERSWSNFVIRVNFKPQVVEGRTYLVRDGIVRLTGPQLKTTQQISLRTVCAKVFPDDLKVGLWPEDLRSDERFADLDIEQIDIRDGWLGLSVGPRHTLSAAAPPAVPTQR